MTDQEIELSLYKIILGKINFTYKKKKYRFRSPSIQEKLNSINIYHRVLSSEKYNEWLRESGIERFLIYTQCWRQETLFIIKQIEKELERAKIDLYKNRMNPNMVQTARKKIESINQRNDRIMKYKYSVQANTLEYYANTIKNEYLMCKCLTRNGNPVFVFKYKSRPLDYQELANKCFEHTPDTSTIKEIARSNVWRPYWTAGKSKVFGKSAIDLTDEQRTLISFSQMYDNIMEHPEAPEEFVLQDDDMLDGWIYYQKDKAKRESMQNNVEGRHPGASEVFMVANSQDQLDTIHGMNDMYSRGIVQSRINTAKTKGEVSDVDLPDIQQQFTNTSGRR